jgi:hypothetical protein
MVGTPVLQWLLVFTVENLQMLRMRIFKDVL